MHIPELVTVEDNSDSSSKSVNHTYEMTPNNTLLLPIGKFKRALIVDDSKMNRKFNRRLLDRYFEYIDEV